MTWPSLTAELKSANNFSILPEIWLPTSTLTTGLSFPLAVTTFFSGARVTVATSYKAASSSERFRYHPIPTPPMSTARNHLRLTRFPCASLIIFRLDSFHSTSPTVRGLFGGNHWVMRKDCFLATLQVGF